MSEVQTDPVTGAEGKKRLIVMVRRGPAEQGISSSKKALMIGGGALLALLLGLGIGYRSAEVLGPSAPIVDSKLVPVTERVSGGLYALELSQPAGKARWMLEFDAEIVTREGPTNPLQLRNALEKLVIDATSMPLVQVAEEPDLAMREAMLAIAAQDFPWLVDIYMTRSDIRSVNNKLRAMGEAVRGLE